jgi:hypothetical protein
MEKTVGLLLAYFALAGGLMLVMLYVFWRGGARLL